MVNLPQIPTEINIKFLPSLPATVSQVLAITSDPESNAEDLIAAIIPDQSMCAAILHIANSAFFGMSKQVSTLKQAVVVLGHREIRNIVISRAVYNAFPQLNKTQHNGTSLFWEHSFRCALLAMIIGKEASVEPGEIFVAGLIHDIGKLPLLMTYPEEYILIRNFDDPYYGEGEQELYGTTHSKVGCNLTQKWLFPPILVASTTYHHQPEKADDGMRLYPALIQLADAILLLSSLEELAPQEIYPRLFASLPKTLAVFDEYHLLVTPEKIGKWLEEMEKQAEENRHVLSLLAE